MDTKNFETILNNLNQLILETNKYWDMFGINLVDEGINLDYNQLNNIKSQLQSDQSKFDQICHNELYHLIGMGDLTQQQLLKFMSKVKLLCKSKDRNKRLLTIVDSLRSIKNSLDSDSEYKLSVLYNCKIKINNK